jgi:hypothetical protein
MRKADAGDVHLSIVGHSVWMVSVARFTPYLRVHFWPPDSAEGGAATQFTLSIERPMTLATKSGDRTIVPERGADSAYLDLLTMTVEHATALQDGGLVIDFDDGGRLHVPSDEYEAWQLHGDDGSLIVSIAGGGLAIWDADPASAEQPRPRGRVNSDASDTR